jgi:hypothetical protein
MYICHQARYSRICDYLHCSPTHTTLDISNEQSAILIELAMAAIEALENIV